MSRWGRQEQRQRWDKWATALTPLLSSHPVPSGGPDTIYHGNVGRSCRQPSPREHSRRTLTLGPHSCLWPRQGTQHSHCLSPLSEGILCVSTKQVDDSRLIDPAPHIPNTCTSPPCPPCPVPGPAQQQGIGQGTGRCWCSCAAHASCGAQLWWGSAAVGGARGWGRLGWM